MGFFSRFTRKSRDKKALKIQYPETCGVAPEVLDRMCIALDASHHEDDEPAPCFTTADRQSAPQPPTSHTFEQSIERVSEACSAELDKPIDEDEVVAPPRAASVRTTNSSSSPAPEEPVAPVEKPKEAQDPAAFVAQVMSGQQLGDGQLDSAIEQARWNLSRKTVVLDALEVDREDLLEQLKEARERLRRLEEEDSDEAE